MALFQNQSEKVDPGQIQATNIAAGTPLVADGSGGAVFDATGDIPPAAILLAENKIMVGDAAGQAAGVAMSGDVTIVASGATTIGAKKVVETMIALADGKVFVGDAGGDASAVTPSGDVTITNTGVTAIGASKVTNAMVQPGAAGAGLDGTVTKFVANANVIGGLLVIHQIDIADASADTDVVLTHKTRIIDAWFVNSGIAAHAANDTLQLKNGASAITGAVAKTATVDAIRRFDILTAATRTIAAAGTLRVTAVKDTNVAATVFVLGIRVA